MRSVSVQIQPERAPDLNVAALTEVFAAIAKDSALVRHHAFAQGHDYHNFTFGTTRAADLWREIQRRLFDNPLFGGPTRKASIVVCSSESGWHDYLLLFHFDPAVKVDSDATLD